MGLLALVAAFTLDLSVLSLLEAMTANKATINFFTAAFMPAFDYQAIEVPDSAPHFLLRLLEASWMTVWYAAGGMAVALLIGTSFGFFCSSFWWVEGQVKNREQRKLIAQFAFLTYFGARTLMTLCRSVHELLWAVLFLAAFGVSEVSAMLAIGIPAGGMLAKIFAEIIDESDHGPAEALRACGLGSFRTFIFAQCPTALPDLVAYLLYRFECALRSSAVLGFFGLPTIGFYLAASFENLHYREVWSYLYALFFLVIIVDVWSSAIRRRIQR